MMENQFSFLLTLFLLSKFLKQVLITFTMISWFDGASIILMMDDWIITCIKIHAIIQSFQLSGNKRNWFRVTVMSFHQQIRTDMTILNHRSYKFGQTNFNGFSRANYSFQWLWLIQYIRIFYPLFELWSHLSFLLLQPYHFPWQHFTTTGYDLKLHLRYRNSIWNKKTEIEYCLCTKML